MKNPEPIYSGWYCPKCPPASTFINMASQSDIDEHMKTHEPIKQEGWEELKELFYGVFTHISYIGGEHREWYRSKPDKDDIGYFFDEVRNLLEAQKREHEMELDTAEGVLSQSMEKWHEQTMKGIVKQLQQKHRQQLEGLRKSIVDHKELCEKEEALGLGGYKNKDELQGKIYGLKAALNIFDDLLKQ